MNRMLLRYALIATPIFAVFGVIPISLLGKADTKGIITITLFLSALNALIWGINIAIVNQRHRLTTAQRYLLSYMSVYGFVAFIAFVLMPQLAPNIRPPYPIAPFIGGTAINSIILLITNLVILQFEKRNATIEIQQLKVVNLEAQKQILLQQLQPHFLFNALSTLKALIEQEPDKAVNYSIRLSDFLRYSVEAKDNEVVSLRNELKFAQDYINLQKVRFGDALQCTVNIPSDYLDKKVPVYALQALVENAIKHNAFSEKKPLHINMMVNLSLDGNGIKVENNILPRAIHMPSGTGLANLSRRYEMIANKPIQVIATDLSFTVLIKLL